MGGELVKNFQVLGHVANVLEMVKEGKDAAAVAKEVGWSIQSLKNVKSC